MTSVSSPLKVQIHFEQLQLDPQNDFHKLFLPNFHFSSSSPQLPLTQGSVKLMSGSYILLHAIKYLIPYD